MLSNEPVGLLGVGRGRGVAFPATPSELLEATVFQFPCVLFVLSWL